MALTPSSDILPPLAATLGDPAGIGPEIIGKAWAVREAQGLSPFFAIGNSRAISTVWRGPIARIGAPDEAAAVFGSALPCLEMECAGDIVPGRPETDGARCALHALEMGIGLVKSGAASALVTGPVGKTQLYGIGFTHPGQTEFIAERCGISRENAVMMLAGPSLRVIPVTVHLPLRDVPDALSIDLIRARALVTARGLCRNFGIEKPRLVVAGLNPHAGESGNLGREEIDIILPAIESLRAEGLDISGPYAPDALFHESMRETYDAALCMYHDQALIPLKTLHFDEGVNMTLGLPIVRTSPDHGTAFGIAGRNIASPGAMIAAIRMAEKAARARLTLNESACG
ncbi:4-hydroxythreonine-4-phosphate dehydrogenase PdxA [Sphingobium sp. DEHP117]|uniref:4-hydroxythreonine-4-phosphate dehydrogenase PdxA n=1 Tax=Sphingobium sp. DEHP117 TaxID=2993436 RepID=UPI0027D57EA1|nr:4-hydroxythreonine-4-phosphate dehydrogenase PdxA [Sphingobium sp. DEHP117]MDQ4419737.1 4-hydroxythreonine-4-phosphate dehydrogenase PdxA [Sphingobium sp. DEHP117]